MLFPFIVLRALWRGLMLVWQWIFYFSLVFCLLFGLIWASINYWLPWVSSYYMRQKTGFRLNIKESNCSLYRGVLDFRGMTLKTPEDSSFRQEDFARFHQVRASIGWMSLYRAYFPSNTAGEVMIPEVDIDVEKFVCESGKSGDYNFKLLGDQFALQNGENPRKKVLRGEKATPHKPKDGKLRFVIAKVRFHLGTCELYKRDGNCNVVNVDRTWHFENIRSWSDVCRAIVADVQAMGISVAVGGLLELVSDLPVLRTAKHSLKAIHRTSKALVEKIATSNLPSVKEVWDNSIKSEPVQ